jgi:vesicle coat complex subunit
VIHFKDASRSFFVLLEHCSIKLIPIPSNDLNGNIFKLFPQDDDPYVRKTAAICVAKLYDINAELVEDRGFLEALKDLISDNNPMVVANAVAALAEIQDSSVQPIFEITSHTLSKLLTALNECTEYDTLLGYI